MNQLINYPHLASLAFSTPLYATPQTLALVKSFLEPRMLGQAIEHVPAQHHATTDGIRMGPDLPREELSIDEQDVRKIKLSQQLAVISVHGILAPRRGTIDACTELTSYESLNNQIRLALNNDEVEEIVLDFHTGGGAAMGCKESADMIFQARQTKPVTAIINFAAYSAGYFLASACSRIICSPTAGVGSIGVIMETYEVSRMEEQLGITYNTFYRGEHKNNGSPHKPISEQTSTEINRQLDQAYDIFTGSVAQYRNMDQQDIINTQARLYSPEEVLQIGLVDEILPAQQAVNRIAQRYHTPQIGRSIQAQARAVQLQTRI